MTKVFAVNTDGAVSVLEKQPETLRRESKISGIKRFANMLVVNADNSNSLSERESDASDHESGISDITKILTDDNFSAHEVSCLITQELARLVTEMREYGNDPTKKRELRKCFALIKTLGALQKIISNIAKNQDELNFEETKLAYVCGANFKIRKKAAGDALGRGGEATVDKMSERAYGEIPSAMPEMDRVIAQLRVSHATDASDSEGSTTGSDRAR
jgi:hypothetical protein